MAEQIGGSVNYNPLPTVQLSGPDFSLESAPNLQPDAQEPFTCFPNVPAGFNANRKYYPGLGRSYLTASYTESPTHGQITYETTDITTPQLGIRKPISPDVIMRWQLAQTLAATPEQVI